MFLDSVNHSRNGSEVFLFILAVGKIHSSCSVKVWTLSCRYSKGSFPNDLCRPKCNMYLKIIFKE